jgi:hypothetical protein
LKEVEQWQSLVNTVTWWDSSREHSTKASYIHSTENTVTLHKDTGEDVTVPIGKLDFNSRVRVSQIRKLEGQLLEDATAFLAAEDTKRKQREKADEAKRKERAEMERIQNASPVANAPPGPVAQSPSPKVDVPVAQEESPDSQGTPGLTDNPPALKKLLAKVTAISPDDVARYENLLREPSLVNLLMYNLGKGSYAGDEVRGAINLGLEKPAVSALIKLIQEKKSSTDKADLLICAQAIRALGQFSPAAREAAILLAELQNYKDIAVRSAAELALSDLNKLEHPASPEPTKTQPAPTGQEAAKATEGAVGYGNDQQPAPTGQEAARGPEQPAAGLLTFQVKSLKTQKSYEYSDYRGNASITAKAADDTLLVVSLTVHNGGQAWETFSSSSFRIVDQDGKPVDSPFQGFGKNVIASGETGIETSSFDGDGNAFLKIKGRLDANEPRNTLVDWELAPGRSYAEMFVFVVSAQTQGPRFEMAKKTNIDAAKGAAERGIALRKEFKNVLRRKGPSSNEMLKRTATVTVPESDGWRELINTIRPDVDKKQAFFMMLKFDPLYKEDGTFLPQDSAKFRQRFKSIPQPAITDFLRNNEGSNDVSAAVILMQIDSLFENDQFQAPRLDLALQILEELKRNKDN